MADRPQSSSADEINVKVKTMQPATYELKIPLTATVGNLKQLLVDKTSVPQDRQRIIYKGRVLDNDQQLQAHGVQEGHTLHLVERAPSAPASAAEHAAQVPGQGQMPIAVGSLDFDTEETDVNALLSSIFTQFGGQGGMPGFAAGEGENAAGGNVDHQGGQEAQFIAQQLMSTLQGQAGQDFGMQALGGMPGERRPNMLASIQTYLDKLQEIMQNPSILLPSLSYPPGQEHELREQRQLVEAVRGILTPAVRSALSPEQQAFLDAEASWQPPAPAPGSSTRQNSATQRQSGAAEAAVRVQQNESAAQQATSNVAADHTQQQAAEVNTTAGTAAASGNGTTAMVAPTTDDNSSGAPAASSSAEDSLAQAQPFGSPVQPQSEPAQRESSTSAARASAAAAREGAATARQAASQAQESASQARESAATARQSAPAARQSTSAARESASGGRTEDSSRRRRRRAAISPVVTMALGSLLQTTLEGDAFQDPANVLSNAAQLLLSTHSFEGDRRAQVLANLRSAGSHLYRLAPLLMELARACSAAVAAMQGDVGPLALSSAHYIRPDGSRPAIGYTPASGQQFMTSNMSIPLFPGMPLGAMHLGPDGVRPTMAGPAPAANGPTNAAGNRGGAASNAGPEAAAAAGAGADANRAGQAIGLNIGTLLQSAFAGAGAGGGGHPNRPGVSIGESRQVIQVPGAPPVTIRFGTRPPGSHPPPPGQQSPVNSPVSLQVGNGTPVDLSPIVQRLGAMLGSAIQSAVSAASPSGPAPAATPTATAAASAAGPSGNHQSGQPAGNASAANAVTADTLLNPAVMQHLARALMHSLSPFISQAAPGGARGSNQAGAASAATRNTAPVSGSAGTTATAAAAGASGSGDGQSRSQLGLSDSLDAMIGMNPSADAFVSQMDTQGLIDALTQAGASSVNIQGPIAPQEAGTPHSTPAQATAPAAGVTSPAASSAAPASEALSTQQLPVSEPAAGPASSLPSSQALPDLASASAASSASAVTKPASQRAVGLGSAALPPRDKGSKKSHPRSPTPISTSPSADQSTSSRQSPGSRPAPSQAQQDNVKRARRGSSPPNEGPSQSPATAVGGLPSSGGRGEAVEEIAQPNRGAVQASSAGGLDALMAGMFGGGGGSGGGGGLNMNSLMQVAGQMMSDPEVSRGVTGMIETLGQRAGGTRADQSEQSPQAGGGGADAGGGFGAIMQSLGPMMQQLAVGAGQSQGTGTQQVAGSAGGVSSSSSSNWQEALSELDEGEKAEWECIIREDLEKQADLAPERYKDHSTAYLAGTPPSAASTLLPGGSAGSHDEDSD